MPSDTPTEEVAVTSASSWKGATKEGQIIELPSGNCIRVRRSMDLLHLLKQGRIPNPLGKIIQRMIDRGGEQPNMADMDDNAIGAMLSLVDETIVRCVTEPIIAVPPKPGFDEEGKALPDMPEDGETAEAYQERLTAWLQKDHGDKLPLPYLDMDDRMYIFVFAQGFAADLATFRAEQERGLASLQDEPAVPVPSGGAGGG